MRQASPRHASPLRERKALPGLFAGALLCAAGTLHAAEDLPIAQPVVTLSASASTSVPNDRMRAVLRAEADDADATTAARVVNPKGEALPEWRCLSYRGSTLEAIFAANAYVAGSGSVGTPKLCA